MRKTIVALIALLVLCACSSIDCPIQNLVYTVYSMRNGAEGIDTLKDTLSVFTVTQKGKDALLLYNRGTSLTTMNLPISYTTAEDTLVFLRWKDAYECIDTVWIQKTNIPHFESVDCKASFFHEITGVRCTHHGIDSIIINKSFVDYDPSTEHFHIYFKAHN